ncbi:MAG TPA: hypothetical protein VLF20_06055, partial [Patescibacteria group bacterium]|nr:hypothetical protein [Patescibacteria group bacterium]
MPAPGEAAPAQPVRPQEVNRGVLPKREGSAAPLSSPAREFFASYVRDVPLIDQPEGGNIDFEKWR